MAMITPVMIPAMKMKHVAYRDDDVRVARRVLVVMGEVAAAVVSFELFESNGNDEGDALCSAPS